MKFWQRRRLAKEQSKLLLIFIVTTLCCILCGFAAGFTYGTGNSIVSLFIHSKTVAPPANTAISKLDTVSTVLDNQPKPVYQQGYNCIDFAWTAMRTLQWKGQPSAIVRLGYSNGTGHAVLLVPTSDKGYQFIEPQTNQLVHPMVGSIYDGQMVSNMTILEFQWMPFDIFVLSPAYGMQGWEDPK